MWYMEDSIFTKIINGEIPCHKVYEDDKTLAFLTINPVQPGHTLVVPKKQVDHIEDLPDEDYAAVWATVKKVAKRIDEVFNRTRVGIQVAGLEVPHAHVYVFPFDTVDQFLYNPDPNHVEDSAKLAEIAASLKF